MGSESMLSKCWVRVFDMAAGGGGGGADVGAVEARAGAEAVCTGSGLATGVGLDGCSGRGWCTGC